MYMCRLGPGPRASNRGKIAPPSQAEWTIYRRGVLLVTRSMWIRQLDHLNSKLPVKMIGITVEDPIS